VSLESARVDLDLQTAVDLDLAARSLVNVLVTASNAADRAAWARTLHDRSAHRDGPFVVVCPAMNRRIHAADIDEWFARAARGTLFIDDIGQLGPDAQVRLSSLLSAQSCRISATTMPDGDGRVRVIAGSGRSLCAELAAGAFDDTLFYRLNVIHIDRMHQDEAGALSTNARDVMSQPP
jgi:two-component system response regulator HydG